MLNLVKVLLRIFGTALYFGTFGVGVHYLAFGSVTTATAMFALAILLKLELGKENE